MIEKGTVQLLSHEKLSSDSRIKLIDGAEGDSACAWGLHGWHIIAEPLVGSTGGHQRCRGVQAQQRQRLVQRREEKGMKT